MDTRKNILEIKNMHTYFFTDNGVVKSVDGVDIELLSYLLHSESVLECF